MDRYGSSLAVDIFRSFVRSTLRSGLLSCYALHRQLSSRLRYYDAQPEHAVLAGLSEPGDLHGPWSRAFVYPESGIGGNLV